MHVDTEIFSLLVTVAALFVVGIPQIRRTVFLPRDLQIEDIPAEKLTPAQAEFLDATDRQVAALNYFPFKTYHVPNLMGHNMVRVYLNPSDPAKCVLTMVAAKNRTLFTSHVEFATRYADGTCLAVNNNAVTPLFDPVPGITIHRYKGLTDVEELKRRHDAEAETMRQRGVVFYTRENYVEDFRQYHVRFCEHQLAQKLLSWDASSNLYRATTWTAVRGIRNYFNPLAGQFSLLKFLAGLLLGGGLPAFVLYERIPLTQWVQSIAGANGFLTVPLLTIAAYTVAGISIGLLFSRKTFIWGMLLGILPTRLLFGTSEMGYGLWMAMIADLTGRFHNRRKNIL